MLLMLKEAEVPTTKLTSCKKRNTAALLVNKVDVLAEPLENSVCLPDLQTASTARVDILKGEEHFQDMWLSKFGSM